MGDVSLAAMLRIDAWAQPVACALNRHSVWVHGFRMGSLDQLFRGNVGELFYRQALLSPPLSDWPHRGLLSCGRSALFGRVFSVIVDAFCGVLLSEGDNACGILRNCGDE